MEVEYAFLAQAAEVKDDLLYVQGGDFEEIKTPVLPIPHREIVVVSRIAFDSEQLDRQQDVVCSLWNGRGSVVSQQSTRVRPERSSEVPSGARKAFVTLNFDTRLLSEPGEYTFHVSINGQHLLELPLRVRVFPTPRLSNTRRSA